MSLQVRAVMTHSVKITLPEEQQAILQRQPPFYVISDYPNLSCLVHTCRLRFFVLPSISYILGYIDFFSFMLKGIIACTVCIVAQI